jgi:hypothetical protein
MDKIRRSKLLVLVALVLTIPFAALALFLSYRLHEANSTLRETNSALAKAKEQIQRVKEEQILTERRLAEQLHRLKQEHQGAEDQLDLAAELARRQVARQDEYISPGEKAFLDEEARRTRVLRFSTRS